MIASKPPQAKNEALEIPGAFRATSQDKMNWASRAICDQQLHLVIQFDNLLDMDVLRRAVRLSLDAEPILGCLFVPKEYRSLWLRREDLDGLDNVTLSQTDDLQRALLDFIARPSDPAIDPLIEVAVFRGEKDLLCVKVDHVVSDAGGARDYGYLLASIYTALSRDYDFSPAINHLEKRGMMPVWSSFSMKQQLHFIQIGLRFSFVQEKFKTKWSIPGAKWGDKGATMLVRTLDRPTFQAIRSYAKQKGVTINDVVLTAFFRSMFRMIQPTIEVEVPIQVSVDLRRYLPPGSLDCITNLSSGLFPQMARKEGQGFGESLSEIKTKIDAFKASDAAAVGIFFMGLKYRVTSLNKARREILEGVKKGTLNGVARPLLSNIGTIESARLKFGDNAPMHAYITTPIAFSPFIILGVTSFDESMTFTLGYCQEGMQRAEMETLLNTLVQELLTEVRLIRHPTTPRSSLEKSPAK